MPRRIVTMPEQVVESPRYDTHVHTIHCGHADPQMTPAAIVARAAELELRFVSITEHLHQPAHWSRLDRIREDLLAAGGSECPIYLGAEIDADAVAEDGSLVATTSGLAYTIASTHQYPGGGAWWNHVVPMTDAERERMKDRWFAWAADIVANPVVDTFAHPGVLLAKNGNTASFDDVVDRFAALFAVAAAHGTRIELNELAAKKFTPEHRATYPKLMRAAKDAGCQLVLACDAHRPSDLARFEWTLDVAAAAALEPSDFVLPAWRQSVIGAAGVA